MQSVHDEGRGERGNRKGSHLLAATETKDQVEGGLLLDIVIRESASVLELLTSKDETLLVWWDALFVLNLGLHVVDGVGALDLESDGLSSESLDEDLHTTTETKDQVKSRLLLNIVIRKSATILELLAGEDQALLVWRNTLLVLDLGLDIVDGVGRLHLEGDSLAGEGHDEDLHTTTETEDEMESALLLDVVVGECAAVLELLAGEDEALLVWGDSLLVLDLGLDVVDGIGGLHLKGDGLAGEGLDEDLHGCGCAGWLC
jgi:hypothetical protein